ncbi:MAG: hypothetical protein ACE5FG_06380 [Myxococcota bacterium]
MHHRLVFPLPLLPFLALLLIAPSAPAQSPVCPAPISTCRILEIDPNLPLPLDPSLASPEVLPIPLIPCPPGYECVCVPSCPRCDDCAAQVCVEAKAECRTACDCPPGLGCFDGRCIAGFAPVYCCDSDVCPAGQQCQHRDGSMGRCKPPCVDELWLCDPTLGPSGDGCGPDRVCSCTASCPFCEDCGPPVCLPPGAPTPYRCGPEGGCARPGDHCVCASSCPGCDDCALAVCVPDHCSDPRCEERLRESSERIRLVVRLTNRCHDSRECVRINTSTRCRGTCGAWVNRRHADRARAKIRAIDELICASYQEDGCPFATPACLHERGVCVRGHCIGVPIRFPPLLDPIAEFMPPSDLLLEPSR